jgi:hypothetical protein
MVGDKKAPDSPSGHEWKGKGILSGTIYSLLGMAV